jgi:two-component system response regulator CpxR
LIAFDLALWRQNSKSVRPPTGAVARRAGISILKGKTSRKIRGEDTNEGEPGVARGGISVLLVEGDAALGAMLAERFAPRGIELETVRDGKRGLERALDGGHDLLLLDVTMPGLDGFELLRQIRRASQVPVIMLTARAAQIDRVAALETGADDCLPKPLEPDELVARIRAVLRRAGRGHVPTLAPEVIEVEGLQMIPSAREVRCAGRVLNLTSTEYEILEQLVRSAGRTVSRDKLIALFYQRRATPFDRALDVHVSHLRKKLGPHGGLIRTVRGVGYLFGSRTNHPPDLDAGSGRSEES